MPSRFLQLIQTRKIGGSDQATATELDNAANEVYLEPKNQAELLDITMVNDAIRASRQNGGLPKGSLSTVSTVSVGDSSTVIVQPTGEAVYQIIALSAKAPGSGADINYQLEISDGTTTAVVATGTAGAGGTTQLLTPFRPTASGDPPFLVTSNAYLKATCSATCPFDVVYHVLES
jgi:hypothetical protein